MNHYNTNFIQVILRLICIPDIWNQTLQDYHFIWWEEFVSGHVAAVDFASFLLVHIEQPLFPCIVHLGYELEIQTGKCQSQTIKGQTPFPWHLSKINHNDNTYQYFFEPGIDLWILDTGINIGHVEFKGLDIINMDPNFTMLSSPHGTGVTSAATGNIYGTAKKAKVYNNPVCKYGGSCGSSDIDKGLFLIVNQTKNEPRKRFVVNMSFGTYFLNVQNSSIGEYYDKIFEMIVNNGGIIVVAAGNSKQDACHWLYSYSPHVISVGSIDQQYNVSGFSNYGSCVDIWSFGSNVPVAYSINNNYTIQYKSGTSFSAPIVSGLIINLLSKEPDLDKDQILNYLYEKYNNLFTVGYQCNNISKKCCRSTVSNTRLDKHCKSYPVTTCPKQCRIRIC